MTTLPDSDSHLDIEGRILTLLTQRALSASICPSDVARSLSDDEAEWRALMPSVREVAVKLAQEGRVLITQRGATLNPDVSTRGPIRLRRGPRFPAQEPIK